MKISKNSNNYERALNAFGIGRAKDPFPIAAPHTVDYWADNRDVLKQLIKIQLEVLNFTTTRLFIFWGPIGGGKTFGLRYLQSKKILEELRKRTGTKSKRDFLFVPAVATQPRRTGELTANVYRELVRRMIRESISSDLLFRKLRESAKISSIPGLSKAVEDLAGGVRTTITGTRTTSGIEDREGFKFLTFNKSKLGKLESINDQVSVISTAIQVLLEDHDRIVVTIDELELLSQATQTERLLFSDFIRRLHDEVDEGLTIILVFTMDTYGDVEELLQKALVTRVSNVIDFKSVSKAPDLVEYVQDCIRLRADIDPKEVIESEALKRISTDLLSIHAALTFREINKQMRRIFADVAYHAKYARPVRITLDNYVKAKPAVSVDTMVDELRGVE